MINDVISKVLICSHNGEKFIWEQVMSILNQTRRVDEIIIYDFNSKDSTPDIVRNLCISHSEIEYFYLDFAEGPAHSFLFAINHALKSDSREFLLHISDQDDVWLANKNAVIISSFLRKSFDFSFHDVLVVDAQLKILQKSYYSRLWNVERDFKLPNQFYSNCVIGHTCTFNTVFLRNLNPCYDIRIPMHDWYLVNEGLVTGAEYVFHKEQLSLYRQHENNILGSKRKGVSILNGLRTYGKTLSLYHDFLIERHSSIFLSFNKNMILTVLLNVRPLRKILYLFISKILVR